MRCTVAVGILTISVRPGEVETLKAALVREGSIVEDPVLKFSIMTEPHFGGTYEQMLAAARLAEDRGLVSFARCDHYLTDRDPTPDATDAFATLAGLARDTSTIRLCVLVTPITFRHPAVIAKSAAHHRPDVRRSLRPRSRHRVDGLRASILRDPVPGFGRALGAVRRSARLSRGGIWTGPVPTTTAGTTTWMPMSSPSRLGLRIVIGGSGKSRTPRLAGTEGR